MSHVYSKAATVLFASIKGSSPRMHQPRLPQVPATASPCYSISLQASQTVPPTPLGKGVDHDLHWAAHLIRKSLSRAECCLLEFSLRHLSSAPRDNTEQVVSATQRPSDIVHTNSINSNMSWLLLSAHRPQEPHTGFTVHLLSLRTTWEVGAVIIQLCTWGN